MNVNIYIEDTLGKKLQYHAKKVGKPRNAIVREAIREWIEHHETTQWPESILKYEGCPSLPQFESFRDELLPPKEDPFK